MKAGTCSFEVDLVKIESVMEQHSRNDKEATLAHNNYHPILELMTSHAYSRRLFESQI